MRVAAKIFGVLASVLLLLLLVGLLLPGTWEAEADTLIQGPPQEVFPRLNGPEAFAQWSPMPESGLEFFGPEAGVGSGMRWNDPQYGVGEFRITESVPESRVGYSVEVESGAMKITGTLSLQKEGASTRLTWRESGDFGWNPLLGFTALTMSESQKAAMEESLKTLRTLVEEGNSNPGAADPGV